jgi:hypothetical protein
MWKVLATKKCKNSPNLVTLVAPLDLDVMPDCRTAATGDPSPKREMVLWIQRDRIFEDFLSH